MKCERSNKDKNVSFNVQSCTCPYQRRSDAYCTKISTAGVVIVLGQSSNIRILKMAQKIQLSVAGAGCHFCMKRMKTLQREKYVFARNCCTPLPLSILFSSSELFILFSPHQPFLSCPLQAVALIIPTSFTFVSSVCIHSSASLSAFSVLPHLAHPSTSSSLMTAAGSSIDSRGVWCVCVCVSTVVRSKWPPGSPGWHLKCTHMEHSHG